MEDLLLLALVGLFVAYIVAQRRGKVSNTAAFLASRQVFQKRYIRGGESDGGSDDDDDNEKHEFGSNTEDVGVNTWRRISKFFRNDEEEVVE
jgi:hypothetical protein